MERVSKGVKTKMYVKDNYNREVSSTFFRMLHASFGECNICLKVECDMSERITTAEYSGDKNRLQACLAQLSS